MIARHLVRSPLLVWANSLGVESWPQGPSPAQHIFSLSCPRVYPSGNHITIRIFKNKIKWCFFFFFLAMWSTTLTNTLEILTSERADANVSFLSGCPLPCPVWPRAWLLCGGKAVVLIKAFSVVFDNFTLLCAMLTVSLHSKQKDDTLSSKVIFLGDREGALLEKRWSCVACAMWTAAQVEEVICALNDPGCCLWKYCFSRKNFLGSSSFGDGPGKSEIRNWCKR